jgi:predicted tellurium resistance membrane protein TerC
MTELMTMDAWIALSTLTAMEIVLGIDNIVFVAILVGRLPPAQQSAARQLGIGLALLTRLALLFAITWVMTLTVPLFFVLEEGFSGRDLILLAGGLFLIAKATFEIHDKLESGTQEHQAGTMRQTASSSLAVISQIVVIDIVFSLDSVVTAVGMAQQLWVMVTAMVIAVGVMLVSAGAIGAFVTRHPTLKILALSFLLLIGVMLVAEGMGVHVNKGYIYFAMAFSLMVELLNMRLRRAPRPVVLHEPKA